MSVISFFFFRKVNLIFRAHKKVKKVEDLREKMHDEALRVVKQRLLLEAIVKEESLNISDEEALKEAEHLASHYNMTKDEFLKEFGGIKMVKYDCLVRKAIELLKEND